MLSRAGAIAGALCAIALFVVPGPVMATVFPPPQINYQGVLRGPADEPLTGTYEMTFRFFDAETGGNEILIDRHIAASANEVIVDGGLFSVELGGGLGVVDGSGPGTYTSLIPVFRDYPSVWLEVTVGTETLSPRTRVLAAGYALNAANAGAADVAASATNAVTAGNATNLNGQPASFYLDTSSTPQAKAGALRIQSGVAGVYTVQADMLPGGQGAILAQGTAGFCELGSAAEGAYCGGSNYGGFFYDTNQASWAYLGFGSSGLYTSGTSYGVYASSPSIGLYADGPQAARFVQSNLTDTNVNIAYSGYGVLSRSHNGIYNLDVDNDAWAYLGQGAYKVQGSGTVSFVQNDPDHSDKVVIYHAPESSEVNVYTRGSGKLEKGLAHITLDPTFALTANPDLGLTAQLTPRGAPVPLAIEAVSSAELLVRGPQGSDVAFDYQVMGLRIGFEELPPVTPKKQDAMIPRTADGQDVYAAHPELRSFNALERYKTIEREVGRHVDPDLRAAARLRNRIGVGHPIPVMGADGARVPFRGGPGGNDPGAGAVTSPALARGPAPATLSASDARPAVTAEPSGASVLPMSQRFPAASAIEAGDVVVLDPAGRGAVRRSDREADTAVVGIALGPVAEGQVEVAVGFVATVRADAGYGAIRAGDLLVSSPAPGAAMRAGTVPPGTLLGKALEPLESGLGTIRVLVVLR
jgi:hypothetical protein